MAESAESERDANLRRLFQAAHEDRHLKLRLLHDPRKMAEEWGVTLNEPEVERLTKLGNFVELATEAKSGALFRACDPRVCYPATVWLKEEVVEVVRQVIFYPFERLRWIFYPASLRGAIEEQVSSKLGLTRRG